MICGQDGAVVKLGATRIADMHQVPRQIRNALYDYDPRPKVVNYVYGLGGRDIMVEHFKEVAEKLEKIAETGKVEEIYGYLNLRE